MKSISLFSGAGGSSYGLELAGFDVEWAVDHEEKTKPTFDKNHSTNLNIEDITELDPKTIDFGVEVDDIDVVFGGPPCPTFSLVGRSKINSISGRSNTTDERHQLYQDYLRFVEYVDPKFFVMENVKGMTSAENEEGKPVVDVIKSEMEELGYNVTYTVLDAADFGVPQHRERLFFIGNRVGVENPDMEQWKTHRKPKTDDEKSIKFKSDDSEFPTYTAESGGRVPWNTVADAILDLPPVVSDGDTPPTSTTEYTLDPVSEYQSWVRDGQTELANHVCRGHNMRDLSLYKLLGEGVSYKVGDIPEEHQPYRTDIFPDKFKKQSATEPSSTVVAHLHKDGNMFIHPNEARSITVREAARLQSFPDSFEFPVARTHAFKQIGNAVPPLLAQAIGTAISRKISED